jgi:hypothetical protein
MKPTVKRFSKLFAGRSMAGGLAVAVTCCATAFFWVLMMGAAQASEAIREFTARHVTQLLFKSLQPGDVDLSGRDLSSMDLSKLDFKSARMHNAVP